MDVSAIVTAISDLATPIAAIAGAYLVVVYGLKGWHLLRRV